MIILTGASGGIGKEVMPYLVKIDQVIGIYNKSLPAAKVENSVIYEKVDVENSDDIKKFIDKWKHKLSNLTVIHSAALKIDGLVANYSEDDWDSVMGVNLKGNFLFTQGLLPIMIKQRFGRLIHISSVGAIRGSAGTIAYSTSKTGLIGMSRVLTKEYARFNITSNILALGNFKTGLFEKLKSEVKKKILSQIPSGLCGDISNIANAIAFLIKSEYVNGSVINIDGGM